jgi:hypothetical protein
MMKNPIVVLVKGAKSSADKERNPFDEKYQTKLIKMLNPRVDVQIMPSGYLPQIISDIRQQGTEIIEVLAGDDRIGGYQRQIASFNKQMPKEKQIAVKFTQTPRVTSASKVRALIRADDFEGFKKEVPKKLWKEYDAMKKKLGVKTVSEGAEIDKADAADKALLKTGTNRAAAGDKFAVVNTKRGDWKTTHKDHGDAMAWADAWNRQYGHKEKVKVIQI